MDLLRKPADETVTPTVPPGTHNGPFRRAGIIHHIAELPDKHVTTLYGAPVSTAARTVIDIARATSFTEGVVVADSALRERRTSKTELRRMLAHCDRWPGISQARQVVHFADGLAESVLESCARVSFRDQGLPAPELQVSIVGRDRTSIAELRRDRLLREAGFEVIHFTWKELFSEPARVAARIREAFNRSIRLTR